MLDDAMIALIRNHTAGMVATTDDQGRPKVSPKATFVVLDDKTLAYGDIRSPGTRANIAKRPEVEICFIDVVTRRAVRVTGTASVVRKSDAPPAMVAAFETVWADYLDAMSAFVRVDVTAAEAILSPAYDRGITEAELRQANLAKLNAL